MRFDGSLRMISLSTSSFSGNFDRFTILYRPAKTQFQRPGDPVHRIPRKVGVAGKESADASFGHARLTGYIRLRHPVSLANQDRSRQVIR